MPGAWPSSILARFHFALVPSGVLFLGKAGRCWPRAPRSSQWTSSAGCSSRQQENRHLTFAPPNGYDRVRHLRDAAGEMSPVAQLVVDGEGLVVQMNQALRSLFGLSTLDMGRPLQDLEITYRPFELRSCIERAYMEWRPVTVLDGRWAGPSSQVSFLELRTPRAGSFS
jgi:two-component system, chemotaxis family, CheB/CheR fusion protein